VTGAGGATGTGGATGAGGATPDAAKAPDLAPDLGPDLAPDVPPTENLKVPGWAGPRPFPGRVASSVDPTMNTMTARPRACNSSIPATGRPTAPASTAQMHLLLGLFAQHHPQDPGQAHRRRRCANSGQSGNFNISAYTKGSDIWIEYDGSSSTLQAELQRLRRTRRQHQVEHHVGQRQADPSRLQGRHAA